MAPEEGSGHSWLSLGASQLILSGQSFVSLNAKRGSVLTVQLMQDCYEQVSVQ